MRRARKLLSTRTLVILEEFVAIFNSMVNANAQENALF
jgi:hypothetical protein